MKQFRRRWRRIAITCIPLVFAWMHAVGVLDIDVLDRLDNIIYDARLRATMPRTLDPRVVIVDIDEKSLSEYGWPWSRDKFAALVEELFDRQKIALLGFDIVFAEPDESSGLKQLQLMAQKELRDQPGFADRIDKLKDSLDFDARFAKTLQDRPIVLGYYFTSDRDGRISGVLPEPVMRKEDLQGRPIGFTSWNGFGASIDKLARAAPVAGYFNSITESDGVVRSLPLVAEYEGRYYESIALALFRVLAGMPQVLPGFPQEASLSRHYKGLESVVLKQGDKLLSIPVDERVAALVPFRGEGGVKGGSYRYVSAADVLSKRLPAGSLDGTIILVGTTAPGLFDLRVTPVGQTYPGVETHANVLSGLLDGNISVKPDYAVGYEVVMLALAGLILAFALPLLSAMRAILLSLVVVIAIVAMNFWLYIGYGLVLPVASAIVMALTAFALNMSYGYFVESRSKRELANLFGTYVPPELVDEMVKDPDSYSMAATNKDLTVMFCDMRGFTKMSERMEPIQLQALLNEVFSRLTELIRAHRGTIDKYMGDCVMAFWGAPVDMRGHAGLSVQTAMEMSAAVHQLNAEHRKRNIPEIGIGIGLNTGNMCVGDMGSDIRRSYTVIGDAVNLGSRLEGLSKTYGVDIVASETTRAESNEFAWQELDKVRVKGKEQAVAIFWPMARADQLGEQQAAELASWTLLLAAYRAQDWEACDVHIAHLQRLNPTKYLYQLYAERVASMRLLPHDPDWDGATNFETK
jgi:adenylate cyclase